MPVTGPKVLFPTTQLAGAVINSGQIVKRGADVNTAIPATGSSATILGVAYDNQPNIGYAFPLVNRAGEMPLVIAGAAISLDAPVTSDANGNAVTAATGNTVVGVARQAATAAQQLIVIELSPRGVVAP